MPPQDDIDYWSEEIDPEILDAENNHGQDDLDYQDDESLPDMGDFSDVPPDEDDTLDPYPDDGLGGLGSYPPD